MKLLLYCTKGKKQGELLAKDLVSNKWKLWYGTYNAVNGKIVAECDFEVEEIKYHFGYYNMGDWFECYILENACLNYKELDDYLQASKNYDEKKIVKPCGYGIHIKNLHIFDKPKELKDLEPKREIHQCIHGNFIIDEELEIPIKAPQNMMRVKLRKSYYNGIATSNDDINANEETLEDYILISIRPEWLVNILNGEKTIEVRKKVLKEMIK